MTPNEKVPPFNILLDPLPEDIDGFVIRTDYRVGIQIALCLEDRQLNDNERTFMALSLLYGRGLPPLEAALVGMDWYMRCGQPRSEGGGKQMLWLDYDAARIYASFRQTFGIEIHRSKLHWFEFMSMLDSLDEDSSLAHAMQIRGTDTSTMKGKERAQFERMKRLLTPVPDFTDEEQSVIDDFYSKINA